MNSFQTGSGIQIHRTDSPVRPGEFDEIIDAVETRRGGVFSSGMEYPGRYSRWHMAFVDPCVEVTSRGRDIEVAALNARGRVLLPALGRALLGCGESLVEAEDVVRVRVPEPSGGFAEEERSRQSSVFTGVRALLAALACEDEHLGFYGAFGYDLAFQFEPMALAKAREDGDRELVLQLPDALSIWDREREIAHHFSYEFEVDGVSTEGLPRGTEALDYRPATEAPEGPKPGSYAETVRLAKTEFAAGNLFEVVPSHRMHAVCDSPAGFYRRLRAANPAPYEFFINLGQREYLVGASPEMYVRVTGDRVETCPIAGTVPRGADALGDAANIAELLGSLKEESELTMCTDVDRNDKARVCVPGSVRVIGRRQIEIYSRLIHTVDHIEGRLRPEMDAVDAFLTHMWAVTVTGAPKTWAMRFIEEQEATPRQWYGGAIGKLGLDGSMNTGLTLRTAQIRNGVATVRAGATLLFDSDPDAEERETYLKARALLEAVSADSAPVRQDSSPVELAGGAAGKGRRVLLVDHEDSFVHTLADYFRQHEATVSTVRFGFDTSLLDSYRPDLVVLSPGPGRPNDFGCAALLDELYTRGLPVFGVCLGLQAMVEHAGGELSTLDVPWHGKPARIAVSGGSLFEGLPEEFTAARYHSLYATPEQVGGGFAVTAATGEVVMAIEDAERQRFAVQFHPESILTAAGVAGHRIIGNALRLTA
ncbi:anthranilate synthase component I [Stackebrandtia nassauensis]|uniref:Anthranilate synthase n=1 Tax=Stackebrandtia nassauensis (strain DSM 44728 / CIP 108903 / NRRL B-16338 / NBRC 102104 / LLR-40K-21) TaxID=446470 RepID=D3Q700_STANL|nr:anthranilate synthase component I [Stackebrandtia nassauensis]ADD40399.1 anthranilate synthase [Stackebrandtia nassauensis DSM 44728]